jgi:hypothetical protein
VAAAPWTHVAGGSYRVRGPTSPAPAPPYGFGSLPSSGFDPTRQIAAEEAERGGEQAQGGYNTARSRDLADYATRKRQIEQREGYETTDYEKAKQLLGESFKRLAGRQGEQANTAGVLSGGAVLQSAAKRNANEGKAAEGQTQSYEREKAADTEALAALAQQLAPPDAANPLGGRSLQDIATQEANTRANNAFYGSSQLALAGAEAARNGYTPPPVPASTLGRTVGTPAARPAPRSGGYRYGGPRLRGGWGY